MAHRLAWLPKPGHDDAMRRFLYLSPYFPPQTRVGALRPLKFARHLPDHGWAPLVLADLWQESQLDADLVDAIPETTMVVRDWSGRAAKAWRGFERAPVRPVSDAARVRDVADDPPRRRLRDRLRLPRWLDNPELIPLGEHGPRIPHALAAARKLLQQTPCEAIVVNADPFAACLVGTALKRETGLPLIIDLRDPWALCELRRPLRPALVAALIARLERDVMRVADRVLLNTETTLGDYREYYEDLPEDRFDCIRNHADRELIADGAPMAFERFTLLFLGNFGRFIKADVLIRVLAELRRRGIDERSLQLVVTGRFPEASWRMAQGMGVAAMIVLHPHVPYREIGAVMAASDLLVLLIQPRGRQRLASKLFDYLASDRPILAISENAELTEMLTASGAGTTHGYAEITAIADQIAAELAAGRQRVVTRRPIGATSQEASARLAMHLDAITASAGRRDANETR
jgi:glycosyltransferase involved in cell wall biosynthesis